MKKVFIIHFLIILCLGAISASVINRVSISEEMTYQRYNKIWTSPTTSYYSVESLASNPILSNDFDIMFTTNIGITLGTRFGYQWSFYDRNRFVSFPKNINSAVNTGLAFSFSNVRLSLSALLRSSFQTSRNSWISQIGGEIEASYVFSNGICFGLGYRYLYCYEMITSGVYVGLGYQLGGKK